ncbi:hypothetical protein BFP72_18670 [Reichenbachiella sp. 5M10]|nr:hypothetical protein BFP72_18670 [Reichenbachiella sp. 5M10]
MFNPYYASPALTTMDGVSSVSLISRNQWTGYETSFENEGGAPTTQFLNYSSLLRIKDTALGIGGTFIYDELGPRQDVYVQLSLAYHYDMPRGRVSFGLRPTLVNRRLDFTALVAVDPDDPTNFNQLGTESQFKPDLAGGIAYSTNDYVVALGVDHLITPAFDYGVDGLAAEDPQRMVYSLYASLNYRFSQDVMLVPALLVKTNIDGHSYDVSARAVYQEKLWVGLSYRDFEAVTFMLGCSFLQDKSLSVGYAFDYTVLNQEYKQATSHELFVRYNLPTLNSRTKKIIRTPRFRF